MNLVKKLLKAGVDFNSKDAVKKALSFADVDEEAVERAYIEFKNQINEKEFKETAPEDRVLFLPHCLRDLEKCQAKQTAKGLECQNCGACSIGPLKDKAEYLGYNVYIVPGGSLVRKITKEEKPKAVLGVACYEEVEAGIMAMEKHGVITQAVLLEEDGCVNTKVNEEKVIRKLKLGLED